MKPASGDTRRLKVLSTWFGLTSLYLLLAVGAVLTTYHHGIRPHLNRLAEDHTEHIAELVFASMYSLMLEGAETASLNNAAFRYETAVSALSIRLVRGPGLVQEYGDRLDSQEMRSSDPLVQRTQQTGERHSQRNATELRFAYPAIFTEACLECHKMGSVGEVAGVITVKQSMSLYQPLGSPAVYPLIVLFALAYAPLALLTHRLLQHGHKQKRPSKDDRGC
jgi:hypothetical protein